MALGNQFKDTYHYDDDGNLHIWSHPKSVAWEDKFKKQYSQEPVHTVYTPEQVDHHVALTGIHPLDAHSGVAPHQGMLFSPFVGTGLKEDPTVPQSTRESIFREALGATDSNRLDRINREGLSDSLIYKAQSQIGPAIQDAAVSSGIPTHVMANVDLRGGAVLGQERDFRSNFVPGRPHRINLSVKANEPSKPQPKIEVNPLDSAPFGTKGEAIPNPNFRKIMETFDRKRADETYGQSTIHENSTFFDHNGNDATHLVDAHPDEGDYIRDANGKVVGKTEPKPNIHPFNLPEGWSANVFSGKGQDTADYIATPFQVEHHPGDREYGDGRNTWFHTRHKRVIPKDSDMTTFEVENFFKVPAKEPKTYKVDTDTLVHEIGHAADYSPEERWRGHGNELRVTKASPQMEGVADGFADRHHSSAYKYEDSLTASGGLVNELVTKNRGSGYGADHPEFKSSKTGVYDQHLKSALYVAARTHAAHSDSSYLEVPTVASVYNEVPDGNTFTHKKKLSMKDDIISSPSHADAMMLGHLYHHHAHVRDMFDAIASHPNGNPKLLEVAQAAANSYREATSEQKKPKTPSPTNMELF